MSAETDAAMDLGIEGVRVLTREEGRNLLDRQAQRVLGMSAEEFVEAWESGVFDDNPDEPELVNLALLIPFAR